jgi:hypothetical protein
MKYIQIIDGTFGLRVGYAIVPKKSSDPPFEAEDAKADRLVRLGVAEYADAPVMDGGGDAEDDDDNDDIGITKAQIKDILDERGVDYDKRANKDALVVLLEASNRSLGVEGKGTGESTDGDGDGEDGPVITPADVVE